MYFVFTITIEVSVSCRGPSVTKGTPSQMQGVLHAVLKHFQHSLLCNDCSKIFCFLVSYCNWSKNVNFLMSTIIGSLRGLKEVQNLHYCEIQTAALSVTPHCYWICVGRYLENFGDSVFEHYIDTARLNPSSGWERGSS